LGVDHGLSRSIQLGLRLGQGSLRRGDFFWTRASQHAGQVGASGRQPRFGLQPLGLEHHVVQAYQHITGLHRVSAVGRHLGDAARNLRRDDHLLAFDEAGGRDGAIRRVASATGQENDK
jgi:hypothetical protein